MTLVFYSLLVVNFLQSTRWQSLNILQSPQHRPQLPYICHASETTAVGIIVFSCGVCLECITQYLYNTNTKQYPIPSSLKDLPANEADRSCRQSHTDTCVWLTCHLFDLQAELRVKNVTVSPEAFSFSTLDSNPVTSNPLLDDTLDDIHWNHIPKC